MNGEAGLARRGALCRSWFGEAVFGEAGKASRDVVGSAWNGPVGNGRRGSSGHGPVSRWRSRFGLEWQARLGCVRKGDSWAAMAWRGKAGADRQSADRIGVASWGKAGNAWHLLEWLVALRLGQAILAWQARLGEA